MMNETLTQLNAALHRPFIFLHELAHYTAARALGMAATRHSSHTTFYPDDGANAAIFIVLLAPAAIGLSLLFVTVALLLIAPKWWIIPVHTGLLGLWFVTSSLSDIHSACTFLRRGHWPTIENPDELETIGGWITKRLHSRI